MNSVNFPKSLQASELKDYQKARVKLLNWHVYDGDNQNIEVIRDDKEALIITYEKNLEGIVIPYLISFDGRRSKVTNYYRYNSKEQRQNTIDRIQKRLNEHLEYKASKKAKQSEGHSNINIGDVFRASWGYEQTNNNFYEVIGKVGKSTLEIREISQERIEDGYMSGQCKPVKGQYISEVIKKRLSNGYLRIDSVRSASKVNIKNINGVEIIPSFYWSSYA